MSSKLLEVAQEEVANIMWRDEPIPKTIYMAARDVPETGVLYENMRKIAAMNPGWSIQCFDNDAQLAYVASNYGKAMVELFVRISALYGAARADLFRYLCIFRSGGLYLDIKSSTVRPLDEWVTSDDRYVISQWANDDPTSPYFTWGLHPELSSIPGGEFYQWYVLASAGHPFLKAVIQEVLCNIVNPSWWPPAYGWRGVLLTTGPVAYTRAIARHLDGPSQYRKVDVLREGHLSYTCFPQLEDHKRTNGAHYSLLKQPVIAQGAVGRLAFPVLQKVHQLSVEINTWRHRLRQ